MAPTPASRNRLFIELCALVLVIAAMVLIFLSTQSPVDKSSPVYKAGYDYAFDLYTYHPDLLRYVTFPEGRCVLEWPYQADRWEPTPAPDIERSRDFGEGTPEKRNWEAGCRDGTLAAGWSRDRAPLPT